MKVNGLIECISEFIGEDINELMSIQKFVMDTWMMKNTSTEAYISNLSKIISSKLGVVAGAGMDKLADVLDDETKMKKVANVFDKVLNKIK